MTKVKVEAKNSDNPEDKEKSETNKEETEINKLEEKSTTLELGETDWKTIQAELELLFSTWPAIVLNLQGMGANNEDIVEFSNTLDDVILNVKNKDKALSAIYMAKLYSYLPKFIGSNTDEIKKETLASKMYIVNAYAFAEKNNFDKMNEEITKAENAFKGLVNNAKFVNDERKYNVNKAYILIEELKNSLITNDKEIFYIKYKNTIEELNILS